MPQIGYLTYDGTHIANGSKICKKNDAKSAKIAVCFISPLARQHQWQKKLSMLSGKAKKILARSTLNTRIFFISMRCIIGGVKMKALQVIENLAPSHHIGRLVYEQIKQDITDDNLKNHCHAIKILLHQSADCSYGAGFI